MISTSKTQSKWERASKVVKKYAKYLVLLAGKHLTKGIGSAVIAVSQQPESLNLLEGTQPVVWQHKLPRQQKPVTLFLLPDGFCH